MRARRSACMCIEYLCIHASAQLSGKSFPFPGNRGQTFPPIIFRVDRERREKAREIEGACSSNLIGLELVCVSSLVSLGNVYVSASSCRYYDVSSIPRTAPQRAATPSSRRWLVCGARAKFSSSTAPVKLARQVAPPRFSIRGQRSGRNVFLITLAIQAC